MTLTQNTPTQAPAQSPAVEPDFGPMTAFEAEMEMLADERYEHGIDLGDTRYL